MRYFGLPAAIRRTLTMLSVRCPALVRAASVAMTLLGSHAFGQTDRSVDGRLTFASRPVAGVAWVPSSLRREC